MRVMAVDYGDARTGIAISDATQTLTGDAFVIKTGDIRAAARVIAEHAINRDVSCVIVGYPKNMDGTVGFRAKKSEEFVEVLKALMADMSVDVKLWDERLTTVGAHRVLADVGKSGKKRKQTIDAVAASLILESYLGSVH